MKQRYKYIIGSFLTCSVLLQGCNSVKKTLGIDRDAPDEFSVSPSCQPLDMPPKFFKLPVPTPGQPRPQDMKAREAEKAKIIGSSPVQTQSSANERKLSEGQKAILEMAGANNVKEEDKDIRNQIDEESRIKKAEGNSVLEKLGIKKADSKEVINPQNEALELQKKGIPQTPKTPQDEVITDPIETMKSQPQQEQQ